MPFDIAVTTDEKRESSSSISVMKDWPQPATKPARNWHKAPNGLRPLTAL